MDRPRHAELIKATRATGASVALITDGDVAGVIHTTDPDETGIDIYLGIGGAPEGVLAAAALRCIWRADAEPSHSRYDEKRTRAAKMGVKDPNKKYDMSEMVRGDCLIAATGVTTGSMLQRWRRIQGQPYLPPPGRDAFGDRHHALDRSRASAAREVPSLDDQARRSHSRDRRGRARCMGAALAGLSGILPVVAGR